MNNPAILIPSYQPSEAIITLVKTLLTETSFKICVVDDGSGDEYAPVFSALENLGCPVVHHTDNRGKGAALKTGITNLLKTVPGLSAVITADGDGQHVPKDILRIAQAVSKCPNSLVLGVRDFRGKGVPAKSRLGNRFSSAYFKLTTAVSCPDTQTGLRGIPASLFPLALSTPGERYDYEMRFLTAAALEKWPMQFVPIQTIYLDHNAASHFRPIADSIQIYRTPARYLCSSLLCAGVDLGGFTLLADSIPTGIWSRVLIATATARVTSGLLNFTLNRRWAFQSRRESGQAMKYTSLFLLQMLLSWFLVSCLSVLPLPLTLIKIPVDCTLFIFSYIVQKSWVFRPKSTKEKGL